MRKSYTHACVYMYDGHRLYLEPSIEYFHTLKIQGFFEDTKSFFFETKKFFLKIDQQRSTIQIVNHFQF